MLRINMKSKINIKQGKLEPMTPIKAVGLEGSALINTESPINAGVLRHSMRLGCLFSFNSL